MGHTPPGGGGVATFVRGKSSPAKVPPPFRIGTQSQKHPPVRHVLLSCLDLLCCALL